MGGFAGDLVISVVDGFLDQAQQVAVVQGVDHVPPVFAGIDKSAQPKFGQVLADHRPWNECVVDEFGDGFRALGQLPEQVQAGWFGQHAQGAGGSLQ